DLLLHSSRGDLDARSAVLVMPLAPGAWAVEMVEGADSDVLLGEDIAADSPAGIGLQHADPEALEAIGSWEGGSERRGARVAARAAAQPVAGRPAVLRDEDSSPFTEADRERLDSLAALLALTLRVPTLRSSSEIDDERGRIARDLHDLAIQELFAVGM